MPESLRRRGITARRGELRAYCGLVRLGPRADGATEADGAEVTDSPAKEEDTEGSAEASSVEGGPQGTAKAGAPGTAKADAKGTAEAPDTERAVDGAVAGPASEGQDPPGP